MEQSDDTLNISELEESKPKNISNSIDINHQIVQEFLLKNGLFETVDTYYVY